MRCLNQTARTLPSAHTRAPVWLLTSYRVRFLLLSVGRTLLDPPLTRCQVSFIPTWGQWPLLFLCMDGGTSTLSQSAFLSLRQDPPLHPQLPGPCVKLMYPLSAACPSASRQATLFRVSEFLALITIGTDHIHLFVSLPPCFFPWVTCDHLSLWVLRLLQALSSRTLGRCTGSPVGSDCHVGGCCELDEYEGYPMSLSETEVQVGTLWLRLCDATAE